MSLSTVSCKSGKGRSATIVLCYLLEKHKDLFFSLDDAQALLIKMRPIVDKGLAKRATVMEFYRQLLARRSSGASVA